MSDQLILATPAAIAELKRIATEKDRELRVRIACKGGGCAGISIDMNFTKWPSDPEFDFVNKQDGIEFIVDVKSAKFLKGATLDYGGNILDRGFKWQLPDATGGCGCGTSFSF